MWPKGGVCSAAVPHFPACLALQNPFQPGKTLAAFTLEIPPETEKHLAYRSGNFGRDTSKDAVNVHVYTHFL